MKKRIPLLTGAPDELTEQLQQQVRCLEASHLERQPREPISSGCLALDRLLPTGGFPPGSLVEWLAEPGAGSGSLALIAAREASLAGGAVVVMDRLRSFYPPAAAALGIDLESLVVIRAANSADEIWAVDQALRCPGVAAVWAPLERLEQRAFRRLQLAAESGGNLGLLLRPATARGQPTWSEVQLLVQPRAGQPRSRLGDRRFRLELTRVRGGRSGGVIDLEMDEVTGMLREISQDNADHDQQRCEQDERSEQDVGEGRTEDANALRLAAQLAHPTPRRRSARA